MVQPQAPPHVDDHETMRFARTILSRPYVFTIVFLASNIFVFLLMWSSSGMTSAALWEPPYPVLIAYGAKLNSLVREQHQWWRFVTPVFIHIGLVHLLVNMYGLWMIGPYVERLYGSAKFVVLWVVTGIVGVIASYLSVRPGMAVGPIGRFLFRAQDGPAAGASGALFGLIGVLFVFGIKFRHELPEGFKRAFGTGLLPVILINLYIGYLGRGFIDNSAHVGGLLSGALFALVINYKRPDERAGVAVFWHILQVAALVLVGVSFVMVARHFRDPLPQLNQPGMIEQQPQDDAAKFASYLDALSAGEEAFANAFFKGDKSGIDPALEQLERAPQIDEKTEALRNEAKSLLMRVKGFDTATKPGAGQRAQEARGKERQKLNSDFESWQKKAVELVKTDGAKYGVRLREPDESKPDSANSQK